jgi:hypothetical protein
MPRKMPETYPTFLKRSLAVWHSFWACLTIQGAIQPWMPRRNLPLFQPVPNES